MRTARRAALAALLLPMLLAAVAPPAAAADWTVRGGAVWLDPDLGIRETDGFTTISLDADGALGVGASAEVRLTDRFGLELGLLWAEPEVELRIEGIAIPLPDPLPPFPDVLVASGDLRVTPLIAGLNVHLTPGARSDVYVGPRLAYFLFGDLELTATLFGMSSTQRIETDDELGYGAGAGIDVPLGGGRWGLNAAVDYLEVDLTFADDASEAPELDPVIVRAGFAYGF